MKKGRKWIMLVLMLSLVTGVLGGAGMGKRVLAEDGSNSVTPSMRMEVDKNEIVAGQPITVDVYITGFYNWSWAVLLYDSEVFEAPVADNVIWTYNGVSVVPNNDFAAYVVVYNSANYTTFTDKKYCSIKLVPKISKANSEISWTGWRYVDTNDKEVAYENSKVSLIIGTTTDNIDSTPAPETGEAAEHFYKDDKYTTPVKTDSIKIYANGGTVTKNNVKTNYKSYSLYTDILASYKYWTDTRGKYQTATGKVIVGITKTDQRDKLVFSKRGAIVDADAAKIASASIKNGRITVTAKSQAGTVYLWVLDTGDAGKYTCCPVTVKMAPTALYTY